jgi:hypothetical protein
MATWLPNSTKWFVHVSLPSNGGGQCSFAALELRATVGGVNLAVAPGLAIAGEQVVNVANALDGNPATFVTTATDGWIAYPFPAGQQIAEVAITSRDDASYQKAPSAIAIYAQDATGKLWQMECAVGLTWSQGQTRTFRPGIKVGSLAQQRAEATRWAAGGSAPPQPASSVLPVIYSTSPAKTSPAPLSGATVSGPLYVYVEDNVNVTKVEFWLDSANPTAPTEAVYHTENLAPFDLLGTSNVAPYPPNPLDTTGMSNAAHTISVRLTYGGVVQPVYAVTFNVQNAALRPRIWARGVNLGTSYDQADVAAFESFLGGPIEFSTGNYAYQSLDELARVKYRSAATNWAWTTAGGAYGMTVWDDVNSVYVNLWEKLPWYSGVLVMQVSPAGFAPNMLVKSGGIINATAQAAYDQLMLNQANGLQDSQWFEIGVSHAQSGRNASNTIIVLGHECNGRWYPWNPYTVAGGATTWKAMFRRAAIKFREGYRSVLPNGAPSMIGWVFGANLDPAAGGAIAIQNAWDLYPGDDVAAGGPDAIGVHHYDFSANPNTSDWTTYRSWNNSIATAADRARAAGKKLFCGEWNIINAPSPDSNQRQPAPAQDNVVFIQMMYDWMLANRYQNDGVTPLFIGDSLFQSNSGTSAETKYLVPANDGTVNPTSRNTSARARYLQLFGA